MVAAPDIAWNFEKVRNTDPCLGLPPWNLGFMRAAMGLTSATCRAFWPLQFLIDERGVPVGRYECTVQPEQLHEAINGMVARAAAVAPHEL